MSEQTVSLPSWSVWTELAEPVPPLPESPPPSEPHAARLSPRTRAAPPDRVRINLVVMFGTLVRGSPLRLLSQGTIRCRRRRIRSDRDKPQGDEVVPRIGD